MRGGSRYADYVPIALLITGFVMIGIGWNGAAGLDYTQGQIPYLISGGLTGLGLVFFGCTALIVRAIRKVEAAQTEILREMSESMRRVGTTITMNGGVNGHKEGLVVAGATSFHLPECRLVTGRDEATPIPREEAVESGLSACRVCNP